MRLPEESLRGRSVLTSDGVNLGQVEGLTVETDGWHVDSLQVKLRKEAAEQIGAERRFMGSSRIPISVQKIQSVQDAIILSVGVGELRQAPH